MRGCPGRCELLQQEQGGAGVCGASEEVVIDGFHRGQGGCRDLVTGRGGDQAFDPSIPRVRSAFDESAALEGADDGARHHDVDPGVIGKLPLTRTGHSRPGQPLH